MKTASFNIDVDPLICYYSIHGLDHMPIPDDPIYLSGIRKFLDLLDTTGIKGTFFITAYGFNDKNIPVLKEIVSRGHEIGNHSFSHDYRLTLMTAGEIESEVIKNHQFIKEKTGYDCKGFRSPGYNSSPDIIAALKKAGYSYDSSLFPSMLYYCAKWILIKLKSLKGHISRSVIYSFSDAFGNYKPEFIDHDVKDAVSSGDFTEIPITALIPPLGIPLIGTSIIAFPSCILDLMLKISRSRSFINIEAHGIDLCDRSESSAFEPLIGIQPDLKYSFERKLERFEKVVNYYKENGYVFKTLSQIAEIKKDGYDF
ncbi:MAG TPA: polysaccharide deacetylase family protein [bacterium]|nr:polysaccharide deacetylase family protein [bacterium]HPS30291.1 polysaccharide deacetylase family protein [bacterium]